MIADLSFSEFKRLLNEDNETAARQIYHLYVTKLISLTAPRLVGAIKQKVDPEDVVQSALRSFFRRHSNGEFSIGDWDHLWSLLAIITLRKCRFRVRQFLTAKRHVSREISLDTGNYEHDQVALQQLGPTPDDVLACEELVRTLFQQLPEKSRHIAELLLTGSSASEIAPQVGLTERSVYRQIERIRQKLESLISL